MSFRLDDEKLLEKYKTIWTKIGDLKCFNILLQYIQKNQSKNIVIKFALTFMV